MSARLALSRNSAKSDLGGSFVTSKSPRAGKNALHGRRVPVFGTMPVLFSVAPLSIHRRSVRYPLPVGSKIEPPACLMSVVTTVLSPSYVCTSIWKGSTFFTSKLGWPYGP